MRRIRGLLPCHGAGCWCPRCQHGRRSCQIKKLPANEPEEMKGIKALRAHLFPFPASSLMHG